MDVILVVLLCVVVLFVLFFFFKQKTAYEMLRSLVGSEMCIRDRNIHSVAELTKYAIREGITSLES